MLVDELFLMLAPGHREQLVASLAALTEKQRRALSRDVRERSDSLQRNRDQSAIILAALGCVTGVRQVAAALQWRLLDREAEPLAVQVLRDRAPHWLPDLPTALTSRGTLRQWRLVRAMVREGLVPTPQDPAYVLAMPNALVAGISSGTVRDMLAEDPGLLNDELWTCLSTEGAGKALHTADWLLEARFRADNGETARRPESTWRQAIAGLAADGVIDRGRLLDSVLSAFLRDWPASDLTWFASMHQALSPSASDTAARQATYARLLAVQAGPPVKLAQQQFAAALKTGLVDPDVLLDASEAPLQRQDKGPAMTQLSLLQTLASRHPACAARTATVAAIGLHHDNIQVQDRARMLISELAPEALTEASAPSRMAGENPDQHRLAPACTHGAVPVPRTPSEITPIASADELADLMSRLVEEADNAIEVERALDGLARFARRRPAHGADVLTRRATELVKAYWPGPFTGQEIRADLAALVLVWLAGAPPGRGYPGRLAGYDQSASHNTPFPAGTVLSFRPRHIEDWSLTALVAMRNHEVAQCVSVGGAQLLSLPTHEDGSITTAALDERLRQIPGTAKPWPLDTGLASMRLPPAVDAVAVPAVHRTGRLLQQQLLALHQYAPSWEVVFDGRLAWRDNNATAGSTTNLVAAMLDRHDPLMHLADEASDGEFAARFEQVTGMWPIMIPHDLELLAAHFMARLNRGLTQNRSASEPLLVALARSSRRPGPVTCTGLVLGLAAKNAPERIHAVDALAELVDSGALDGAELGRQCRTLLQAGIVVGDRIARGLADTAHVSAPAASCVLDALEQILSALPGRRDAHRFIALAAQLASQHHRAFILPAEFTALANSASSSVLAAACRRVLTSNGASASPPRPRG